MCKIHLRLFQEDRQHLLECWSEACEAKGLTIPSSFSLAPYPNSQQTGKQRKGEDPCCLISPCTLRHWTNECFLPPDSACLQSAMLVAASQRVPLILDHQRVMLRWLQACLAQQQVSVAMLLKEKPMRDPNAHCGVGLSSIKSFSVTAKSSACYQETSSGDSDFSSFDSNSDEDALETDSAWPCFRHRFVHLSMPPRTKDPKFSLSTENGSIVSAGTTSFIPAVQPESELIK